MHFSAFVLAMLLQQPYGVAFDTKESCKVRFTGEPSRYLFVKIQEADTGKVVFQNTLRGGQERGVFTQSKSIKIERKSAGDLDYHSAITVDCGNGNVIPL